MGRLLKTFRFGNEKEIVKNSNGNRLSDASTCIYVPTMEHNTGSSTVPGRNQYVHLG